MARLRVLIYIALISMTATGCGMRPSSTEKSVVDPVAEKLSKIPLSADLTLSTSRLSSCDSEKALSSLSAQVDPSATRASALWQSCEELYACSPITQAQLKKMFSENQIFKLGFGDLKGLGISRVADRVAGLYVSHTNDIYLDENLPTNAVACPVLLHELVHRFDPNAYGGEESLRTEYRAYWYQFAFMDELYLRDDVLGAEIRSENDRTSDNPTPVSKRMAVPNINREKLLAEIAKLYHFNPDHSILSSYQELPLAVTSPGQPVRPNP